LIPALREYIISRDSEREVIAPDLILRALENPSLLGSSTLSLDDLKKIPYVQYVVSTHLRLRASGYSVLSHPFYLRAWKQSYPTPTDLRPTRQDLAEVIAADSALQTDLDIKRSVSIGLEVPNLPLPAIPEFPDCVPLDDSYTVPEAFFQAVMNEDSEVDNDPALATMEVDSSGIPEKTAGISRQGSLADPEDNSFRPVEESGSSSLEISECDQPPTAGGSSTPATPQQVTRQVDSMSQLGFENILRKARLLTGNAENLACQFLIQFLELLREFNNIS
jgi:hypothetical protein